MGRKFKVIVGGRSKRSFGWTIPDVPYTLAASNAGVQVTYPLYNYITYGPDTTPVWQLISAPVGVTLNSVGLLTKSTSVIQSSGHNIVVSISRDTAGFEEYRRTFLMPVNATAVAPEWLPAAPASLSMVRNTTYNFGQYATDPNGSALTFSLDPSTPSKYSINPTTGVVTLGNSSPEFTVYQTNVSLPYSTSTQTIQFTAVDPDSDTITYSLPQTRAGITINPTTGLVSIASSAAGTNGIITVRAHDGITPKDINCTVTIAASAALTKKWYPGHYATPDAQLKPGKEWDYDWAISQIASVPVSKIIGFGINCVWGQIETSKGVYNWNVVRQRIAQITAVPGRKVWLGMAFGNYGYGSTLNRDYFPQYAIDEGLVGYAYDPVSGWPNQQFIRLYDPVAMDRMIAFYQEIANQFENDESVVAVGTHETSVPFPLYSDPLATTSNTLTQWKRFIDEVKVMFPRTLLAIYNNGLGNHTRTQEISQYIIDSGCGFAGPDLVLVPEESSSLVPEFWTELYLRGYRSINDVWTPNQAPNQKAKIAYILEQQAIRDESATPQLYYNEGRYEDPDPTKGGYNVTHIIWQMKPEGYVVWDPYPRVPAMNWANVQSYLTNNDLPLRTALPTNLGSSGVGDSNLNYYVPFESSISPFFESWTYQDPTWVAVNSTRAREGSKSLRTYLQRGDTLGKAITDLWRSEVSLSEGTIPLNTHVWIGYSVYFPAGHVFFPDWEAVGQIHGSGSVGPVPFVFYDGAASDKPYQGQLTFTYCIGGQVDPTPGPNAHTLEQIPCGLVSSLVGRWNDIVLHLYLRTGGDGITQLWINGQQLLNRTGANWPTGMEGTPGGYWKMGIYNGWRYGTNTGSITSREIWWDCYRQYHAPNSASYYSSVAPR